MWAGGSGPGCFQGGLKTRGDGRGRTATLASSGAPQNRRSDEEGVFAPRDYDGCVRVYPPKEWERVVLAEVRDKPIDDPWVRAFERFVISPAITCQPDRQGRVLISAVLREHAGLKKKVVFAGGANHFEIWDAEARQQQLEQDLAILRKGRGGA